MRTFLQYKVLYFDYCKSELTTESGTMMTNEGICENKPSTDALLPNWLARQSLTKMYWFPQKEHDENIYFLIQ